MMSNTPPPANGNDADDAFVALALRYLDNETNSEEEAELKSELLAYAGRKALFVEICRRHAELIEQREPHRQIASADAWESGTLADEAAAQAHLAGEPLRMPPEPSRVRSRGLVLAAAAVFLAAACGILFTSAPWRPGNVTSIDNVAGIGAKLRSRLGKVSVVRDSRLLSLPESNGFTLQPGDVLETAHDAWAALRYADGTLVEVNGGTRLKLLPVSAAKHIDVERGNLYVAAAPQDPQAPLRINPDREDEVTVLGTAFEYVRMEEESLVLVAEGKVQFGSGGDPVLVAANHGSLMPLGARPMNPERIARGDIASWRSGIIEELIDSRPDGQRLDDDGTWLRSGDLPAQSEALRVVFNSRNNTQGTARRAVFRHHQLWDLSEGAVCLRVLLRNPNRTHPFQFELFASPEAAASDLHKHTLKSIYVRTSRSGPFGIASADTRVEGEENRISAAVEVNVPESGSMMLELIVSRHEVRSRLNRATMRIHQVAPALEDVYLGFRVESDFNPNGGPVVVENVAIGRCDLLD